MKDIKAEQKGQPKRGEAYHQFVEQRVFRLPQVMKMYGLSKASIYRKMKHGGFPKSVSLGNGRARGWLAKDLAKPFRFLEKQTWGSLHVSSSYIY